MHTLQVDCATILDIPKPNKKWIIPLLESVQEFLCKMAMKPHASKVSNIELPLVEIIFVRSTLLLKVGHIFRIKILKIQQYLELGNQVSPENVA